jgi:hypothetical protein
MYNLHLIRLNIMDGLCGVGGGGLVNETFQ